MEFLAKCTFLLISNKYLGFQKTFNTMVKLIWYSEFGLKGIQETGQTPYQGVPDMGNCLIGSSYIKQNCSPPSYIALCYLPRRDCFNTPS